MSVTPQVFRNITEEKMAAPNNAYYVLTQAHAGLPNSSLFSVNFDTAFASKTTNDLSEEANLYYTDARVKTYADTLYSVLGHTHDDRYFTETEITTNFVPYNGATQNVDLGDYDITAVTGFFSSMETTNLTVDTDVLYVDSINNRVGIGTTTPVGKFHVQDLIKFDDTNYNVLLGNEAFNYNNGVNNIGIGYQAGYNNNITGSANFGRKNTYIGFKAGYGSTAGTKNTGFHNAAIGYYSLYSNTTGFHNAAIGSYSLYSNTAGFHNAAIGSYSLYLNTTGNSNTAIGYYSLYSNTTGYSNIAIGSYSLYFNTTGYVNTAIGPYSLYSNTTGNYNAAIGSYSLYFNTTGNSNIAIGSYSLYSNTTGNYNAAIGYSADFYVPSAITTATAVAGSGLEVGKYRYKVSYVLNDKETALSSYKPVITTLNKQKVNLSGIPTYSGPMTASARKIYRSKVNGGTDVDAIYFYYLVTTINDNSTTTYSDTTADAFLSTLPNDPDSSIMLGYNAKAFESNQLVLGDDAAAISHAYLGEGVYATTPVGITLHATGGQGTDNAGGNFTIAGGIGTGTAAGGSIIFQTAAAGVESGTSANSLSERVRIEDDGGFFITAMKSGATQAAAGAAANELWKTSGHATLPDNVVMIGV